MRRAAGLTLEQLAEASGVSARAISDMERGRSRAPQARTLEAIVGGLGLAEAEREALVVAAQEARSTSSAGRPRLGSLPRGVTDFVGRATELNLARDAIAQSLVSKEPPLALVVHGHAGLGKTAFAIRLAEEVGEKFADGRVYVDLRGVDPVPLSVGECLERLLRALGVAAGAIAEGDDERSAQLRAVLEARRCLLLLDNAGSEEQVRPLLAAEGNSVVVVTSRRTLGGLEGVHRLALDPLAPEESVRLLEAIAAQATDTDASAQVAVAAELCGNLPLALRIAGTRLASRPQWTVDTLVSHLVDADRRLSALTAGDAGVATAFALSHAQLSAAGRVMFRRLGHVPGDDFAAPIASVLAEVTLHEAEDLLEELVELGLLQAADSDRYSFHDLLRLYAVERLRAEESEEVRRESARRMARWLLETVVVAGRWYEPDHGRLPDGWHGLVPLATLDEAGAWLSAETGNWLPALRAAAADGQHQLVAEVSLATYWYSDTSQHWQGWYEVNELSRRAAEALPDLHQRAVLMAMQAETATYAMRRFEEGVDLALEALELAREIGDPTAQAEALGVAGYALLCLNRIDEALSVQSQALDLADGVDDHDTYVALLVQMGHTLERDERVEEAVAMLSRAFVALDERPISPRASLNMQGMAWFGLVTGHGKLEQWEVSLDAADAALPILTELGDPVRLGLTFVERGRANIGLGRPEAAQADLREALRLIDDAAPPDSRPVPSVVWARTTLDALDRGARSPATS